MFSLSNNSYYSLELFNVCYRKYCILYFILIKEDEISDYIDLKVGDKFSYTGSMYYWNKNGGYFIFTDKEIANGLSEYNVYDFIFEFND